jgi:hypothetical protein
MPVIAEARCCAPMSGLPMTKVATEAAAIPMAEVMHGPMMAMTVVTVVMPETIEAVAAIEPAAETRRQAAMRTAKPVSYGIDLSRRDSKQGSRGNGEGFW